MLADVNGDHAAGFIGFGENGAFVSLAAGDRGFGAEPIPRFGCADQGGGWRTG
jgi:hypothetical protein